MGSFYNVYRRPEWGGMPPGIATGGGGGRLGSCEMGNAILARIFLDAHEGPAVLTNSCILQSLRDSPPRKDLNVLFQINNVLAQSPGNEIHTKDGSRLYVSGQLLDYSGSVSVGFVESAVPALFGHGEKSDVERAWREGKLSVDMRRLNCRGSLRTGADGQMQLWILQIALSDIRVSPSSAARGLSHYVSTVGPPNPGVVCTEASRIQQSPLLGLCIRTETGQQQPVKLAAILVKGTQKSRVDSLSEAPPGSSTFMVCSDKATCLLSEPPQDLGGELVGYCHHTEMLNYNLDTERAVVYISGCAVEGGIRKFVVDRMEKISSDDLSAVQQAMLADSAMALQPPSATGKRSLEDFVSPEAKHCRTIARYPTDP